jgi:NADPH2:quinone reductase
MSETTLQLRSLLLEDGVLRLSLVETNARAGAHEVVVQVEATPINPSDLGLLFGVADMSTARFSGTPEAPVVEADVPEAGMRMMAGRVGQSLPVGNEGAGTVIAAGASDEAQALLGQDRRCSAVNSMRGCAACPRPCACP